MIINEGLDNILVRLGIALCSPTFAQTVINEINGKSDSTAVTAALALKADAAATTAALATKLTRSAGAWADRPVTGLADGFIYFATDEQTPYWYNVADTTWYDATGTAHV